MLRVCSTLRLLWPSDYSRLQTGAPPRGLFLWLAIADFAIALSQPPLQQWTQRWAGGVGFAAAGGGEAAGAAAEAGVIGAVVVARALRLTNSLRAC